MEHSLAESPRRGFVGGRVGRNSQLREGLSGHRPNRDPPDGFGQGDADLLQQAEEIARGRGAGEGGGGGPLAGGGHLSQSG